METISTIQVRFFNKKLKKQINSSKTDQGKTEVTKNIVKKGGNIDI